MILEILINASFSFLAGWAYGKAKQEYYEMENWIRMVPVREYLCSRSGTASTEYLKKVAK